MFRFGSYNVQHCQNYARRLANRADKVICPADVAEVIAQAGMDVCVLQEIDVYTRRSGHIDELGEILAALSAKTGEKWQGRFAKAISFDGGEYGVALVSRFPILEARVREVALPAEQKTAVDATTADDHFEDRVLLICTLEIEGRACTVIGTHFGLMPAEQALAVRTLAEEAAHVHTPLLFAGDLNATPESETITALGTFLQRVGEDPLPYTHPSDVPEMTIDYIFCNDKVNARNFRVLKTLCSDHLPILAEIELS